MKYASAFLFTAEAALYFAFTMLFPGLAPFYPVVLMFLGLTFISMILAEALEKIPVIRAFPVFLTLIAFLHTPRTQSLILLFLLPFLYLFLTAALGRCRREYWWCVGEAKVMLALGIAFAFIALILTPICLRTLILLAIFFLCMVFGLRMLRLQTSGSARWLLCSFAELLPLPLAGLAGAGTLALLLHSKKFFQILLTPFALLISLVASFFSWSLSWMRPLEESSVESSSESIDIAEKTAEVLESSSESEPFLDFNRPEINWRLILVILFIIAVVIVLILIFRKKQAVPETEEGGVTGGRFFRAGKARRKTQHARTPSERIRECYRAYLDLQYQRGLQRVPGDTSMDILRFSSEKASEAQEARLRELYIKARYRGVAEKEEAAEAEQLLETMKKNWNAG